LLSYSVNKQTNRGEHITATSSLWRRWLLWRWYRSCRWWVGRAITLLYNWRYSTSVAAVMEAQNDYYPCDIFDTRPKMLFIISFFLLCCSVRNATRTLSYKVYKKAFSTAKPTRTLPVAYR